MSSATCSANAPGYPMSGLPASPFTGSLAAGNDETALGVFAVPVDHRFGITMSMS